ncbi:MAG: hypothetical protein HQK55_11070 [Deltaproteobacteria bacterium]|nr:hypothetical protein [Deltaproteobacteria bacterium]
MSPDHIDYDKAKEAIRAKKTQPNPGGDMALELNDPLVSETRQVELSDVLQIGSKVLIGGGVGLLAGVATIAIAASAAEVVIAGAITKVAGVVGGALGLSMGLSRYQKKSLKPRFEQHHDRNK